MNMDQKIRQAFRKATPNVLGALPAQEQKTKKKRKRPGKLLEALPAVASLAIILGAVALAIPYIGAFGGPGSLNQPTGSGTPPHATTQPAPSTWEGDPEMEKTIAADALSIVEQEGEALTAEVTLSNTERYRYRVTVQRQGILYGLYYDEAGALRRVVAERTETATGLIPESVAYAMAWTDWGKKLEDYTVERKEVPGGGIYYEIRAVEPLSPWEFARYVHAESGWVYVNDPAYGEDGALILADALSIVAQYGETLPATIVACPNDPHDYQVTVQRQGVLYYLYYAKSGVLQKLEVARTVAAEGCIPENVALRLAELEIGVPCELASVEMTGDPGETMYYCMNLKAQDGTAMFTCEINAETGEIHRREPEDTVECQ